MVKRECNNGGGKVIGNAERARRACVRDGNSHVQRARDKGERLERRRVRIVRSEQAGAALPGDGLVELEGRL